MLEVEREERRKAAEKPPAKKEPEQKEKPEAEIQEQKEAPKEKKFKKVFPHSPLFDNWGENLTEEEQREAEVLFQKYGYNVFVSDRLPLNRALPDTRDPRYDFHGLGCDVRYVILLYTKSSVKKTIPYGLQPIFCQVYPSFWFI